MIKPPRPTALFFVAILALAHPVAGRDILVTTTLDENGACAGPSAGRGCSIREAVREASPGDTVLIPVLPPSAAEGVYTLVAELVVDKSLTLQPRDAGAAIILQASDQPGGGRRRVVSVTGGPVTLSGLTIRHGGPVDRGAGIFNSGTLTLVRCRIVDNIEAGLAGGGIYNSGNLTLQDSTVEGNTTVQFKDPGEPTHLGAGLYNSGSLTITDSSVTGNTQAFHGGGIYNDDTGTLHVRRTTVANNLADNTGFGSGEGAAIFNNNGVVRIWDSRLVGNGPANRSAFRSGCSRRSCARDGPVTIERAIVRDNAGDGIHSGTSNTTLSDSLISNNLGRGVRIEGTGTVNGTTVAGNSNAGVGVGIGADVTISNSTISGNTAAQGGGIENSGDLTVNNSTIYGNTATMGDGGGISNSTNTLKISNSILAGNLAPNSVDPDCSSAPGFGIESAGYNLIGNEEGCRLSPAQGDLVGAAAAPIDPLLGPLADNGGLTTTHAFLPGSPAVDSGSPLNPGSGGDSCEAVDQRNFGRPLDGNGDGSARCDMGAFEAAFAPSTPPGSTELVSVDSDEQLANQGSVAPALSDDGRFVAFASLADNLTPNDFNNTTDVFVRDRVNGVTEIVSVNNLGALGDSVSADPAISADGQFVAFESQARNLVAQDSNDRQDIFVRDRLSASTERVSVSSTGQQANHFCEAPAISGDGRFVVFHSPASNLVPGDANARSDVFVHDRQQRTTERISLGLAGQESDEASRSASINADGRFVAFYSAATNLVPADANGVGDVFVRDLQTGVTERVSVSSQGEEGNALSDFPSISGDGRFVVFESHAGNLVPGDSNGVKDVFLHDRQTRTTIRVSRNASGIEANGPSLRSRLNSNGSVVTFGSEADNLAANDANATGDVFLYQRLTGSTSRLSVADDGTEANATSVVSAVSGDGRFVAFVSFATNLVSNDNNQVHDIFLRDRLGGVCKGDLNGDGRQDNQDWVLLNRHFFRMGVLDDRARAAADLNGNGMVDIGDLTRFVRHLNGAEPLPPCP